MKRTLLLASLALASSLTAHAESYGIHFLGTTTDPVTGIAGVVPIGNFNNITQAAATFTLNNSAGTLSAATLTLSGPAAAKGYTTGGPVGTGGNDSLIHGYIDSGNSGTQGSVTLTLAGLTGSSYDLYIYTQGDAPRPTNLGDGLPQYTVNGTDYFAAILGGAYGGSLIQAGTQSTELAAYPGGPATKGNYVYVPGVVPTVGGTITIVTNSNDATFRSPVNGLELVAVPEPSSYALMFAGLGALFFMFRIRRAAV